MKKIKTSSAPSGTLRWTKGLLFSLIYWGLTANALAQHDSIYRYIRTIDVKEEFLPKKEGATEKANILGLEIVGNSLYFLNKEDGIFVIKNLEPPYRLERVQVGAYSTANAILQNQDKLFLFFDNQSYQTVGSGTITANRFSYQSTSTPFRSFVFADSSKLLVGTQGNGLLVYDPRIKLSYQQYSFSRQNFPSNNINCLFKDSNGIVWIGTDKGLAVYTSTGEIKGLTTPEQSLIGRIIKPPKGILVDHPIEAITERFGRIIIGGRRNLHELTVEGDSITKIRSLLINEKLDAHSLESVNSLLVDYRNDLWIAGNILFKYSFLTESVIKVYNDELAYNSQRAICLAEDKAHKKMWVGTAGSGIFIVENGPTSVYPPRIPPSTKEERIPENEQFIADQILFEVNSSDIKQESKPYLDAIASKLNQLHEKGCLLDVLIQGHSSKDRADRPQENKQLSLDRAENVSVYLAQTSGVPSRLIHREGKGDTVPNANCTEDQYALCHRRVEILIRTSNCN